MRAARDRSRDEASATLLFIHEALRERPRNSARTKRRRNCVTSRSPLEECPSGRNSWRFPADFRVSSGQAAPRCSLSPTAARASFFDHPVPPPLPLPLSLSSPPPPVSRFITADEPLTLFLREDIRRDHIFRHDPVFSVAFSVSREPSTRRVHATCTIKDACIMTRERTSGENIVCRRGKRRRRRRKRRRRKEIYFYDRDGDVLFLHDRIFFLVSREGRVTERKRGAGGRTKVRIKTRSIRERRHAREFYARMQGNGGQPGYSIFVTNSNVARRCA